MQSTASCDQYKRVSHRGSDGRAGGRLPEGCSAENSCPALVRSSCASLGWWTAEGAQIACCVQHGSGPCEGAPARLPPRQVGLVSFGEDASTLIIQKEETLPHESPRGRPPGFLGGPRASSRQCHQRRAKCLWTSTAPRRLTTRTQPRVRQCQSGHTTNSIPNSE